MSAGSANVTVTIGAAFAGSFKSVLRDAERDLTAFGRRATKSARSVGRESARAATGMKAIGTAASDMTVMATQGRKAASATKAISTATVKMSKTQVRAARAAGGSNGNAATIMGLPSKGMLRDAQRTMKRLRRSVQPVALNDAREVATAMPKAYQKAVRESVAAVRHGGREMRKAAKAANGNVLPARAGMPAGFGRATRGLPGVTVGGLHPKAANTPHAILPPSQRTGSGVPVIRSAGSPEAPWGSPAAPAPRTPRAGGRRPPGAMAGYGGGAGGGRGGGAARRAGGGGHGVHTHDGAAIGGAVAGAFTAHTIWDAVKGAGEINDLQVLMKLQGRTSSEIAEATARAYTIARNNPAISSREALQSIIDTADVGDRDMKKAARLAPFLARSAKAVAVIGDEGAKGKLGEGQGRALGRVIEDLGYGTKSEGEIKDLVDSVTQGVIATRGIYNPKELLQTVQKSGGMARGWSKDFIGQALPAITMAMGGSGAGDAMYMYQKALTKGQTGLGSAKALQALGLINQKDMQFDGRKFLGINPDSMPDPELLRTNPYEHFKKNIIPAALRKAGINDVHGERERFNAAHGNDRDMIGLSDDDKKAKLSDKFKVYLDDLLQRQVDFFAKAKNQSKMIADFIAQQEQIEAQIAQLKKQPKNALDIIFGENFGAQVEAVTKSFHTLMAAFGGPEVGTAISAMDGLSKGMAGLASAATADPESTKKVMAAFAAITAGLATAGALTLSGSVLGALAAGGPFVLAIGAVAAGLAAWAALDWDGFSESMTKLMEIGKALKSALDFLDNLGTDAKGNSLIGKAVSAMLGNNATSNSEEAYQQTVDRRDAAKKRLESYDPKARGSFPGQKAGLEDDLKRAEADVVTQGDANIKWAERKRKKAEREAKSAKAISAAEQAAQDITDRRNAAKALEQHSAHSDAASQEALDRFKQKAGTTTADVFAEGRKPTSATNVAPIPGSAVQPVAPRISGPTPGSQGAPVVPGAAVAASGKAVVDLTGPVSIKDAVDVKQPLRLVTPVLVTAQGVLAVHDTELQGTMSSLSGMLSTIAGHTASLPAIAASCAAIAAKDFSPKITVNGGGGTGAAGASRERGSFSD